jgi:hypothetical protein
MVVKPVYNPSKDSILRVPRQEWWQNLCIILQRIVFKGS